MRLARLLLVTALVSLAAPLAMAPAQALVAPITGTLLSASGDGTTPLAGATVELWTDGGTSPGSATGTTATTASDGSFSLPAGSDPDYYVKVTSPSNYRAGFIGGGFVQTDPAYAEAYPSATNLGDVYMLPSFIRGYVVNPATGNRVSGVKVSARAYGDWKNPEAVDYTNSRGVFVLNGIQCEDDCYLYFRGHPVNYENGYRACSGAVVATWGDACASPLGFIGKVRLQHL
jgi:hypothetical protein